LPEIRRPLSISRVLRVVTAAAALYGCANRLAFPRMT
jgi:hypothetical protein